MVTEVKVVRAVKGFRWLGRDGLFLVGLGSLVHSLSCLDSWLLGRIWIELFTDGGWFTCFVFGRTSLDLNKPLRDFGFTFPTVMLKIILVGELGVFSLGLGSVLLAMGGRLLAIDLVYVTNVCHQCMSPRSGVSHTSLNRNEGIAMKSCIRDGLTTWTYAWQTLSLACVDVGMSMVTG